MSGHASERKRFHDIYWGIVRRELDVEREKLKEGEELSEGAKTRAHETASREVDQYANRAMKRALGARGYGWGLGKQAPSLKTRNR